MMGIYQATLRVCFTLFVVLGLLGCEPSKSVAVQQSTLTSTEQISNENVNTDEVAAQLLNEILLMAGTPRASDPESCQLLKLGETSCGGFTHVVLYSTESTKQDALLALAERYNQLMAQANNTEAKNTETNTLACEAEPQVRLSLENGLCIPRQMSTF